MSNILTLPCPKCETALPVLTGDGFFDVACSNCRSDICVATGRLMTSSSSRTVIQRATARREGVYEYTSTFSIYANRTARLYTYSVGRDEGKNPYLKNSTVSLVYASSDNGAHIIGYLASGLTGHRFNIPTDAAFSSSAVGTEAAPLALTNTSVAVAEVTLPTRVPTSPRQSGPDTLPSVLHAAAMKSRPLQCPKCAKPFFDAVEDGVAETVCGGCRTEYMVVTGPLLSNPTMQRTVIQRESTRNAGSYSYFHHFSVLVHGSYRSFSYSTSDESRRVPFVKSQHISVVSTRRDSEPLDIIYVFSHFSGSRADISKVGGRARAEAVALGVFMLLLGTSLLYAGVGVAFLPSFGVAIVAAGGLAILYFRARHPRAVLSANAERNIAERQALFAKKLEVLEKRDVLVDHIKEAQARIARLDAVEAKMMRVGEELYKARLDKTRSARLALVGLLDGDIRLVKAYGHLLEMIELEHDDGGLDGAIAESGQGALYEHMDRIRVLEEESEEFELRAAATDEVEGLLHE